MLKPVLPATKLATYDDLLALGEDVRAEVIAGSIHLAPSGLPEHGHATGSIAHFIGGPFDRDDGYGGPGGWWIFLELDVRLSLHNIVRPDLCGYRRDRLREPWGKRPLDLAPDWVCEILSPSNAAHDRVTKAALYAQHGVPFFWLLDPAERVLETFTLRDGLWMRTGSFDDTATARIVPFEAIELDIGRLFPPRS